MGKIVYEKQTRFEYDFKMDDTLITGSKGIEWRYNWHGLPYHMIIHGLQTGTPFVYEIFRKCYCIRGNCPSGKYFLFKWSTRLQSMYNHMVWRKRYGIEHFQRHVRARQTPVRVSDGSIICVLWQSSRSCPWKRLICGVIILSRSLFIYSLFGRT